MITLFRWNEQFLTNLPSVDEQHRRLVDLVNSLAQGLMEDTINADSLSQVLGELSQYAEFHFADEEALMEQAGLDPRFIRRQRKSHRTFLDRIATLVRQEEREHEHLRSLAVFLVDWLQVHILKVDQGISRQMDSIAEGLSPEEAYEREVDLMSGASESMAPVVDGLLSAVHEKNVELQQLSQKVEDLRSLATHDELTGLANRRFAMMTLQQRLLELGRSGSMFSVLLVDLDRFKEVNDRFGHGEGDAVLRKQASFFQGSVRESDLVCRLGGDEFLVICPSCRLADAETIAEKLVESSQPLFTNGQQTWNGAISVGIAEAWAEADPEGLLAAADRALYRSKRRGGRTYS